MRRLPLRASTGSVTLEIAILGPVLLLLTFTVLQVGLWFYARSLALAAAQEGVATGRALTGTASAGVARAQEFLHRSAGDSLQSAEVSAAGSSPTMVRIQVTGRSLSVIPGVPGIAVQQNAQGPVEMFTTPGAGP